MSRENFNVYIRLGYAGREPIYKSRQPLSPVQILKIQAIEPEIQKNGEKYKSNTGHNLLMKIKRKKKKPVVKKFKGELPF